MPAPYRKACQSCVTAKRKCDLDLPRCHRCRLRSLQCQYQSKPPSDSVAVREDQRPSLPEDGAQAPLGSTTQTAQISLNTDVLQTDVEPPPLLLDDSHWPEIMRNIEDFIVPDQIQSHNVFSEITEESERYQERAVYVVRRFQSWPQLFVRDGSTPFIHRKLYEDDMPQVIQDALSVYALYNSKNESNEAMILRVVSSKAKKVIEDYAHTGSSQLEQLASVQALALYQIIRLFDGDIRQRGDAERAEPVLTQWIEHLQLLLHSKRQALGLYMTEHLLSVEDISWHDWLFSESIQRTIITGFTLEGLYHFIKDGKDDSHYKFLSLSFHAQRRLWRANSEVSWRRARQTSHSLPVCFATWNSDVDEADAKPSDMEELGVMMMILIKGIDHCMQWLGPEHLDRFALNF